MVAPADDRTIWAQGHWNFKASSHDSFADDYIAWTISPGGLSEEDARAHLLEAANTGFRFCPESDCYEQDQVAETYLSDIMDDIETMAELAG